MVSVSTQAVAVALAVVAATADAHNYMTIPVATWPSGFYNKNSPSGTIDPTDVLPVPSGMSYNTDPASNTEAYWTAFNSSSYTSLKDLAYQTQTLASGASNECGFSLVDGTAQDLPDEVQWDFFTSSHQGPCEVWCDDTLAFEDWNCAVDYTSTPANLPYDKSKCEGASVLMSIWIALHTTPWQIYTNCAPLTGATASASSTSTASASSASSASTTTTTTTTAPATTTVTPTATTAAPSTATSTEASAADEEESAAASEEASMDADYDEETTAPATTTAVPAATTAAPSTSTSTSTSTSKCSVRRH